MQTPKTTTLISASGLCKAYGRRQVLHDVSIEVGTGQIVGICGENGAGKSTLLRILMNLLPPDTGTVHCLATTGYCPQQLQLFNHLTVEEHFRYFATAYRGILANSSMLELRIQELKSLLNLQSTNGQQVRMLSGGTQQKLNLALSLLHDPDLLILDEPYTGFDWSTYLQFWNIASTLRDSGKGILIVSHLIYDRERFDRLYTLEAGVLKCS